MPAASTKKILLALPVGLIALTSVLIGTHLPSGPAFADEKPWQNSDRVATSVEIDDDGIIIRTESRDGGDPEVIEIISEDRDSEGTIKSKGCREKSICGVRTRIKWDLSDLDDLNCIDLDDCDGDAIVLFGEDIHIGRREKIGGDVVAIGGSIYIEGQVDGDVVALGGSVTLRSRAEVDGDVVAVAGDLVLHDGSEIDGDAISVGGGIEDDGAYIHGDTMLIEFSLW